MPGHEDVEQDDRELALEQVAQRLLARRGDHDLGEVLEHGADGEQVVLVVVDDQHARALRRRGSAPARLRLRRRPATAVGMASAVIALIPPPSACTRLAASGSAGLPIQTRSSASSSSMSTGLAI